MQKNWKENIKCLNILEPVKFKKAISQAEKKGAKFLALMGDNEKQNDEIGLKHLPSGKQVTVKVSDISSWIKAITNEYWKPT